MSPRLLVRILKQPVVLLLAVALAVGFAAVLGCALGVGVHRACDLPLGEPPLPKLMLDLL